MQPDLLLDGEEAVAEGDEVVLLHQRRRGG